MIISSITCIVAFGLIILFVLFSGICVPEVREAVNMFLTSVLPAMFPFYVLSSIIVSSGFLTRLCAPLKHVTEKLFKLPASCGVVIILGLLCGFPIGAKITCDMKSRGEITAGEAARLSAFTNNVGPVFMASVIGSACFKSVKTGLIIWLAVAASSILSGSIICHAGSGTGKRRRRILGGFDAAEVPVVSKIDIPASILSSMNTVLYVGAVIILFSSVTSLLSIIPSLNPLIYSLLYSFLEITGGLTGLITASGISPFLIKCMLTAALASWSGCSVHMQVCGILSSGNIKLRYYFTGKFIQSLIAPVLTLVIMLIT